MGSLFKTTTSTPTLTSLPVTVQDQVNGVEQVPVKNADGSYTYITRALPLTEAQQAEKDKLSAIMSESLAEIQKLSATDYMPDAQTQKVLDSWQQTQLSSLQQNITDRATSEETTLAKRGLADSSAGLATRRVRALDEQNTEASIAAQKDALANSIRSENLALQQNLYGLANSQISSDVARTASAATKIQSDALTANMRQQASLLDYASGAKSSNLLGNSFSNSLGSILGKNVGSTVSGTVSGVAGGLLGTWLWNK